MRAVESLTHDRDIGGIESMRDQFGILVSADDPVEDLVGLFVADAVPPRRPSVGRSNRRLALVDDRRWDAEVTRERPDLRLE